MRTITDLFPANAEVSKEMLRKGLAGPIVNVQGFGAKADGQADDRAAIIAAANAAADTTILLAPGRYRVGADLTLGPTSNLVFLPGAVLVPDEGVHITIDGILGAGVHRIFDVDAPGCAILGTMKVPYVLPQWFGAVTDDPIAAGGNVRAFAAAWSALPSLNGLLLIPPGTYSVDDTVRLADIVDGKARNYYGTRIIGPGTFVALATADFSAKPVVHIEGVEIAANALCIDANRQQNDRSPAIGLAVTRDKNRKGGRLNGTIDISGAYTHAAYYNVSCEICNLQNSTIRNHGKGSVVWDAAANMPGLSFSIEGDSNTRKSFLGCTFLSYGNDEAPTTVIRMGWVSELAFTNCYFYMDNGHVFAHAEPGTDIHNLLIRECRCEVNLNRPDATKAANRFLYIRNGLTNAEISFVNFESPSDALIEIDGCNVSLVQVGGNNLQDDKLRIQREILITNGGQLNNLVGSLRLAIEVHNGSGISYLLRSDISSLAEPPIIGDGTFTLSNRIFSRTGNYETGPPRAQGRLESLSSDGNVDPRAFKVGGAVAFYAPRDATVAWLTDTFETHTITIVCPDGGMVLEHNVGPTPRGYRSIFLAGGKNFHGSPGAIITLQKGYAGWREIARIGDERGTIGWQPGGARGLEAGAGETSPAIRIAGAAFGDFVRVAVPYDLRGALVTGYVAVPDNVRIRLQNLTKDHLTFSSGNWTVAVDK